VCINESDVAILERCGKFHGLARPGCHFLNCCEGVAVKGIITSRLRPLDVRCETKTKDNVFVTLKVNIQYLIAAEKEYQAFYSLDNHESQIQAYVFDVVRSSVPKMPLDSVFEQKEEIAKAVKSELCKCMEEYGWTILQCLIAEIEPDHKVKAAMNEINAAQRNRVATVDKAEAEKILVVKQAEAEAESKYLGGVGIARQRKAIADGLRDSVLTFTDNVPGAVARDVMDLVLITQYFDTLKDLGEKSHASVIFLPQASGASGAGGMSSEQIRAGMLEAHAGMYAQAQAQAATAATAQQRAAAGGYTPPKFR
jgi:regulator of protease activity HflC (stomatin/prohibitin superfamily)